MHRNCFIDNQKIRNLTEYNWNILGLKKNKIGFGLCPKCNLVLQTPSLSKKKVLNYYKNTSIYFENLIKPSTNLKNTTKRHLNLIRKNVKLKPKNVLEVGISTNYNFKQYLNYGVEKFQGLEPSKFIAKKFKKSKFKIFNSTIEDHKFKSNYDLIILSHVIEHLTDPLKCLSKCSKSQKNGDHLLIEVPLLEKPHLFPPCYFNIEHLNYFNFYNLNLMMNKLSYEVVAKKKVFKGAEYPVITILCRKKLNLKRKFFRNIKTDIVVKKYLKKENIFWSKIDKKLKFLDKKKSTYLFGAGLHSSMILEKTNILKKLNVKGIIDSSKLKHGKKFGQYYVFSPAILKSLKKTNIIISTFSGEKEIFSSIKKINKKNLNIVKLYS